MEQVRGGSVSADKVRCRWMDRSRIAFLLPAPFSLSSIFPSTPRGWSGWSGGRAGPQGAAPSPSGVLGSIEARRTSEAVMMWWAKGQDTGRDTDRRQKQRRTNRGNVRGMCTCKEQGQAGAATRAGIEISILVATKSWEGHGQGMCQAQRQRQGGHGGRGVSSGRSLTYAWW